MLTVAQACELLGVSKPTYYKMWKTARKRRNETGLEPTCIRRMLRERIESREAELEKLKKNMERLENHISAWGYN